MKKLICLAVILVSLGLQFAIAQNRHISGKVSSAEDGLGLPGVSVVIKGTTIGASTDIDGAYSLQASPSDVLVFSSVGMLTQEITVGDQTVINVVMETESIGMDEVVVTALGITKSKDKITGAITSVNADNLESTGESGVIQSLSGKTSGLTVVRNSGDPGAGAYLQIRGQGTITGNIQPLIILDGVPINSSNPDRGSTDGVVQQSRLNDINPDDIASVDVMKGASAAAVWGTRAANGVLVITTKKGKVKGGKHVHVDLRASFSWDKINREHAKQSIYGQGRNGKWEANRGESWGDKISSRLGGADLLDKTGAYFEGIDGTKIYPIKEKKSKDVFNDTNKKQVFQTGFARDLGASISVAGEKSNLYISLADWDQDGIIKGKSDYRRTSLRVNYSSMINDKVKFRINTFYSRIKSNRIQHGSNLNGLYLGYLRTSPDFDNTVYKGTYYDANGVPTFNSHRSYRRYLGDAPPTYNNPGWTINEQVNTSDVDRVMINPELTWDITPQTKFTFRYGLDLAFDKRITFFPVNSAASVATGYYKEEDDWQKENNLDLFVRSLHKLNDDISMSYILGLQYNENYQSYLDGSMSNFINVNDQIFDFSNATTDNKSPDNYKKKQKTLGGYAVVNFELYDQILVELTGRAEKSNSFKDAIFYPSASVGWQFTKVMNDSGILSFGKLRAAYGTVGLAPPLYVTVTDFVGGKVESGWGPNMDPSYFGGGLKRSTMQGNPNLNPERKTEFEVGADLRFFEDRLSLNTTYYTNKTKDVIFAVDVPASTGYSSKLENAAVISNKGLEFDLTGQVFRDSKFKWDVLVNFTKNKNEVEDLQGVTSIFLNGFTGTSSRAVEGHALGTLWGGKFARNEDGSLQLDANGFPKQALEEGILGDPNPDWKGAIGSTFSYKGLNLKVLFETSQGGDMWAGTQGVLRHFGISPITANESIASADLKNYANGTITKGTAFRGNIHNFGGGNVALDESWYKSLGGGFGPVGEQFVKDASWTRLREVTLAYELPKSILNKLKIDRVELALTGRNLKLWSDFKGVDPETNLTGASNGRGLDYFTNPGTKSYLFSIKVGF
ncbi:SusC/RagA family TonB-linked outer membrane protein [Marinifilum caeruleilacunae]|uniref:SusC/RagA family TonB-linked outer membrane protein n=1 Tax=Marinifilum caeruleilacunae TaxID=2499076 RepID=A0ABX1WVB9_9BACT|nr:SusC/RagA family TonB-linked outer membrane protein [Marinifilum caeruleilacunae]NOU60039.1 SusC/RagA family TonB-linked outer membrane protein [Marinifilum caeruleilacunae]